MKDPIKQAKRFLNKLFKNYYTWAIIIPLFIPLLVSLAYVIPLFKTRIIEPGELLSFFGTAYGISASFILYRLERAKEKKQQRAETKPAFLLTVTKDDVSPELFHIEIINPKNKCSYTFVYLYDEFAFQQLNKKQSISICFRQSEKTQSSLKAALNITEHVEMIDGYPEYIQILCDDRDGNSWRCCYFKVNEANGFYYYPREIELM